MEFLFRFCGIVRVAFIFNHQKFIHLRLDAFAGPLQEALDAPNIAQLPLLHFLAERECHFSPIFTKEKCASECAQHLGVGLNALLVSVKIVLNTNGVWTLLHLLFSFRDLCLCDVLYETGNQNSLVSILFCKWETYAQHDQKIPCFSSREAVILT